MHPHVKTAEDWHGGQWSPLYSFASCGGVVHSEEHRLSLKDEVDSILYGFYLNSRDGLYGKDEVGRYQEAQNRLIEFLDYLQTAKIGEKLEG